MTWFDVFYLACLALVLWAAFGQRRANRHFDAESSRLWRAHNDIVQRVSARHSAHEKRIADLEKLAAAPKTPPAKQATARAKS